MAAHLAFAGNTQHPRDEQDIAMNWNIVAAKLCLFCVTASRFVVFSYKTNRQKAA